MSDEEKLVSHYRLKTLLRKDGFGAVYLGEDTRDGKAQVLRIIALDQQTLAHITGRVRARSQRDHPLIEQIRQRMKRISELKHSHILPVIEFGEEHIRGNNDIIFYMVSPYEKESLLSYWSARSSAAELISLEVIADLLFQAGEALLYVHKRGLIHQYVRLSSFMLRSSTRSRRPLHLLLTDFWFADISLAILEEGQIAQDLSLYLAPEQLTGHALAASDQYALALLAYELLLGYRLSQVDLSLGLYEHALHQRSSSASAAELDVARRLDLVLARALAEEASARFHNIEEFVYTFRAVARGEAVDLSDEETFKLPAVGEKKGQKRGGTVVAAAAGALAAGVLIEGLAEGRTQAEAEVEQSTQVERHPGLHKTVLTSVGMEATELSVSGETLAETSTFNRQTVLSNGTQGGTFVEEESVTSIAEEQTQRQASAGIAAVTGFAAGLATGAALQRETDVASEQTQIAEAGATALATDVVTQREVDISEEQSRVSESKAAAFAVGLAAGEEVQRERDISAERTAIIEGGALAAGGAVLLAGGLLASEAAAGLADTDATGAGLAAASGQTTDVGLAGIDVSGSGETAQVAVPATNTGTGVGGAGLAGAGAAGEVTQVAGTGEGAAGAGASLAAGVGLVGMGGLSSGEVTQVAGTGASAVGAEAGLTAGASLAGAGAAGTGKVAGKANGAGAGFLRVTQAAGAGAGLVARGGGYRRRRPLIAALLIVLCLCVVGAGVVFALLSFANRSSAIITLTLESHTIQSTYLITAVTTTTNQGQVQASILKQTAAQSKSGQTTGYYAGAQATGFIRFSNSSTGCGCPIVIPAGTAFTNGNGVTVVTATAASVASLCTVTVRAYAATTGPGGDIPANSVHATYGAHIAVSNPYAFSGGQVGERNALVQQSDINKLASSLQTQTTQSAQAGLQSQMKGSQRLAGTSTCQSKTTSNHAPGDFATSVTVTVTTTCSGEAYDYSGTAQIVQQQVQTQAATYFSSQYVLVGALQTTVTNATLVDTKAGTLLLAVKAIGKWGYRFSNTLKQSLSIIIAGKDVNEVQALLSSQQGVSGVKINISGSDQSKMPADASQITIVLKE